MSAEHANQRFFRAVTFAPQYADGRLAAAKRAGRWSSIEDGDFAVIRKIFGVRLKKHPRQYSIGRPALRRLSLRNVIQASGQFRFPVPEVFDRVLPCGWPCLRQSGGSFGERRRRNLLDQRQKLWKLREEEKEIQFIAQRAISGNLWRTGEGFLDFPVKAFLKRRDPGVVTKSFRGKWIRRDEFGGTTDTSIPLRIRHCLGSDGWGRGLPVTS